MAFLQELSGPVLYVIIFFGKVVEVALSTLRTTFINKGERKLGVIFGAGEILLWVIITSTVLNGLQEDPVKIVVYCLAFITGIMLGSKIEEKMAVGYTGIQIVSLIDIELSKALWEAGYGVTILDGHSVDGNDRKLIFTQILRKDVPNALKLIKKVDPNAVISVSTINSIAGGYMKQG